MPASTSYVVTAWVKSQAGMATGRFCSWSLWSDNEAFCTRYSVGAGKYQQVQVVVDPRTRANTTLRVQLYPRPNGGTTNLDTVSVE